MNQKSIIFHNAITYQMLLNNPFNHFWRGASIPYALWIDHHNRTFGTDPQTIGFGAKDSLGMINRNAIDLEFAQSLFKIIPRFEALIFGAAFRFGLIGAEEDMALNLG